MGHDAGVDRRPASIDLGPVFDSPVMLKQACATPVFSKGPIFMQAERVSHV
jgi:hypothetical protein